MNWLFWVLIVWFGLATLGGIMRAENDPKRASGHAFIAVLQVLMIVLVILGWPA